MADSMFGDGLIVSVTQLKTEDLTQVFSDAFEVQRSGSVPIQGDEDDETKADPVDLAAMMLARFHLVVSSSPMEVQGVELPFKVSLHQPDTGELLEEELVGVIDLVVREDGRLVVVEHKTAAKKYGADQLRYHFQPTAYQLALRQVGHQEVGLRFQIVTKTKSPHVQLEDVIRTQADEADFQRTAVGVLRAIDVGAFFPVRGWQCKTCPFQHACVGGRS